MVEPPKTAADSAPRKPAAQSAQTAARDAHKNTKQRRNSGARRQTTDRTIATPALEATTAGSAQQPGRQEVKGVLIGASGNTDAQNALELGAPGLRGARAGGNQTPWLAIGIAGALLMSALIGTQIERRRPQVIL